MADQKPTTFGPYELVAGVNQLTFGADPVVELKPGKTFTTDQPGIAQFLDEHPAVKRSPKPKTATKKKAAAPAAKASEE